MKQHTLSLLVLALAMALPLAAHEPADKPQAAAGAAAPAMDAESQAMMEAWMKAGTPGPQHKLLAEHFVGNWNVKQTMWMDPGAPPATQSGKDSVEAVLGGRQLRSDYSGTFMGLPFQGLGYTGYDNVTGRYTSTWTDSGSTGTMLAMGDYDPATKTYTYTADMADPMQEGVMVPMRMVIRIVDANHHVFDMHETRDGKEVRIMQMVYTRASE